MSVNKSANEKEDKIHTKLRFLFLFFFPTLDTRLNAAHERLGGNLGTLQLDDAPYA